MKRILVMAACLGLPLWAADTVQRSFDVGADPLLDLSNVAGNIEVVAGRAGQIVVTAKRESERIEVDFQQEGNRIYVKTKYPEDGRNVRGGVAFEVEVPAHSDLNVDSVSGSITVSNVSGNLDLNTVSGRVAVSELEGSLKLNSVSGSIDLNQIGVADVDASSISGGIGYSGDLAGGPYRFSSTSGSISIKHSAAASYHIEGSTVSGSIQSDISGISVTKQKYGPMKEISGQFNGNGTAVRVSTVSGSIKIHQ